MLKLEMRRELRGSSENSCVIAPNGAGCESIATEPQQLPPGLSKVSLVKVSVIRLAELG